MSNGKRRAFRILRFFSIASLVSILGAAILLAWLYRQFAIHDVTYFGERGNVELTQSFLNAVHPTLDVYLGDEPAHHAGPLPAEIGDAIKQLLKNTHVVQVRIIDDEGVVVFSTDAGVVGENGRSSGYEAAKSGDVYSHLAYRDRFNFLSESSRFDNQIRSYIPVNAIDGDMVKGVFAVDTDVGEFVAEIERTQFLVLSGGLGILTVLYLVLLVIVRHAARIIEQQEQTIRERSRTLELLSSQLISDQESEKQRVANELHEGIAQTLSGLKFRLEDAYYLIEKELAAEGRVVNSLVSLVQDIIREVRALAMDLRPSSLDDLGVLPTLDWYCRELQAVHPGLLLEQEIHVEERDIPKVLKVVIYRLVQEQLKYLVQSNRTVRVRLQLDRGNGVICLKMKDSVAEAELSDEQRRDRGLHLMSLKERITLSGGSEQSGFNAWGGTTLSAEWPE